MDWLLSSLGNTLNADIHPNGYDWIDRDRQARGTAVSRAEAPVQLTCKKAVEITTHTDARPTMDGHDPTALQHIAHVELLPVDGSGFMHQDPGYLTGQVEQR